MNSLEQRVHRLELIAEAQHLIGLYSNYMSLQAFDRIPELFALDQENLRAEMLWGVYKNAAGIKRLYEKCLPRMAAVNQIFENTQSMEVPIIQAAKDGKTVKGVWVCPGFGTIYRQDIVKMAVWSWQKMGCDFIETVNGLKIWHLHVYGLFEAPYRTFDVFPSGRLLYGSHIPEGCEPDAPPTTVFDYSETSIYPYAPAIPKPYIVFDQDYSY